MPSVPARSIKWMRVGSSALRRRWAARILPVKPAPTMAMLCAVSLDGMLVVPLPVSCEFWLEGRLMVTPHNAFHSDEAAVEMRRNAAETARLFLEDGILRNRIRP